MLSASLDVFALNVLYKNWMKSPRRQADDKHDSIIVNNAYQWW